MEAPLRLARMHRAGGAVHAVVLAGDGMHALAGHEHGLQLVDRRGNVLFRSEDGQAYTAVAMAPGMETGVAMARTGRVYRLDFCGEAGGRHRGTRIESAGIWQERDDLYSLDFAAAAGDHGLIALGHHAPGLTALDVRGRLLWQVGPQEYSEFRGRTWHAAISPDGRTIYAASLGGGHAGHIIMAIDAGLGRPVRSVNAGERVSMLIGLPEPLAVAAVHQALPRAGETRGPRPCSLTAYDASLGRRAWSLECPPGVVITAATCAPGGSVLIAGTNTGEVWRVGAFTGRILARYDLLYSSTVLSVTAAANGEIAAGLRNGLMAFLEKTAA